MPAPLVPAGDKMMFKPLASLAMLSAACVLPTVANAAPAQVTANVNLRTGPSTQYYPILVLPAGISVEVYGCLAGYTWCDVSWGQNRGWISSRYLSSFYYGPTYRPQPARPLPSITFNFGYWDNHYVGRPWYRDRPRSEFRPDPGWDRPRPGWDRPRPGWDRPRPDQGWDRPRPQPDWNQPRPDNRPQPDWGRPRPQAQPDLTFGPSPNEDGRPRPACRPGDNGPDCPLH